TPVYTMVTSSKTLELIYGIDLKSFQQVGGPFRYLEGGPFSAPFEMIVDDFFANVNKVHPGAMVELFNHRFRVTGVVEHGRGGRRFLPITTLQDLAGGKDKATVFYLKLDDPQQALPVVDEIKKIQGMEDYSVMSMQETLT